MTKEILQKSSFGLLRTNPKLSSNVKILVDSEDSVFLESFSANDELSKSKYKRFTVSSKGDYYFDLYRFYNQRVPTQLTDIFEVATKDRSISIKNEFGLQYDDFYQYGAQPKNSKLYTEEFSLFAPMWIEPSNIPDYFVIFRTEDPVSVNTKNLTDQADPTTINLVSNPKYLTDNILEKSQIVTSYDLTSRSNIGRYIRNHAGSVLFPESALLMSYDHNRYAEYNGIGIGAPGFTSKSRSLFHDTWPRDKTIIEYESIVTNGFSELGVVSANILNLEFLFDDKLKSTKYEFYRYFGLFVNAAEYNKFYIDGSSLFSDRFIQSNQIPIPTQNDIGYNTNVNDQIQTNTDGIVLYAEQPPISAVGASFFLNEIVKDMPRIGYVKDVANKFHKIKNNSAFNYGTLRLDDTSINWKDFAGYSTPDNYIDAEFNLNVKGRPSCVIDFQSVPLNDDEFRLLFTDTTEVGVNLNILDAFTITASNTLPATTSVSNLYSSLGSTANIAEAFANCVNTRHEYYPDFVSIRAVSIGSRVCIFSSIPSASWNKIKISSYSSAVIESQIAIKFITGSTGYNQTTYQSSPQPYTQVFGFIAHGNFVGGNDNPKAKVKISADDTSLVNNSNYVTTDTGNSIVNTIVPYMDEPLLNVRGEIIGFNDFDKYYTVNILDTSNDIILTSSKQLPILSLGSNECGLFSIYQFKDFDYDFYSTQYMKTADADREKLDAWYLGATGPGGYTSSFSIGATGVSGATFWINPIIGPSSSFAENGGYFGLMGIPDIFTDTDSVITNEYDRLKENFVKQLVLPSRVSPFISKWVYDDDSLDVRQNPYRLNSSSAFRYPNFGPSFREFSSNAKFYTHEWLYLQKYPPYMTFNEKINSFSYFNEPINVGTTYTTGTGSTAFGLATVDGPTGVDLDYFREYFTRETIGGTSVSTQTKYSTFAYGQENRFSETLFRGVKAVVKPKVDYSDVNYNIRELKFQKSTKYNDYKFAAILSISETGLLYKVIENEKYKTITLLVQAGLMDNLFTKLGIAPSGSTAPSDHFIDRTLLYTLKDKLVPLNGTPLPGATGYQPDNFDLSGAISHWELNPNGSFRVLGTQNAVNLSYVNFVLEMQTNSDGSYNDLYIDVNQLIPGKTWVFGGISNVSQNSFDCQTIVEYNTPYVPPGTPSAFQPPFSNAFYLSGPAGNPVVFGPGGIWDSQPVYFGGGFSGYEGIIKDLAFAQLASEFNKGNPDIDYITYKTDGTVVKNDKVLELSLPFESYKANYIQPGEDTDIPQELTFLTSSEVVGYQIDAMERAELNILSRYNGRYQPKFTDVFYYKDYYGSKDGVRGTRYYGFPKYHNLEFNLDEPNFGKISGLFYNKVNPENPEGILKLSTESSNPSLYPKIDEVAINKRNLYSFMSNWDIDYYIQNIDRNLTQSVPGYKGSIENKAFFGSKIMNIPDTITLNNFDIVELSDIAGGLVNASNEPESVVQQIMETSQPRMIGSSAEPIPKSLLILDVFVTKSLTKFLRSDGFDTEFNAYINPSFSFGEAGLDDDINAYINNNIYSRYKVKKIIFYENQFANNVNELPIVELDLTNLELLTKGYAINENVSIKFKSQSPLDFRLIYNIPKLNNYSISFIVELEKK